MSFWPYVESQVLSNPCHQDIVYNKHYLPNPLQNGYRVTLGELQGQNIDYEKTLSDGKRIHVRDYGNQYHIHWDKFSPLVNPIDHLRYDAPFWWVAATTLTGIMLSSEEGDDSESLTKREREGGFLGFLFGLFTLPQTR
jgi:hypothetical protein